MSKKWEAFKKVVDVVLDFIVVGCAFAINDAFFNGKMFSFLICCIVFTVLKALARIFIFSMVESSEFLSKPFRET